MGPEIIVISGFRNNRGQKSADSVISENHPLWDQKSSLFLGSGIIEARNQRIWWFLSPEITALPTSQNWDYLTFGYYLEPSITFHHCLLCTWYDNLSAVYVTQHLQQIITNTPTTTTAYRACCVRDRASLFVLTQTSKQQHHHHHSSTISAP